MKNQNGLGTVFKLKGKRRKSWTVRVSYLDEKGEKKRKYIGYYETKREAEKVRLEYIKNPTVFSGKTFGEIRELWWNNYNNNTKRKRTIDTEKIKLKNFDILNDYKISDLKLYHLQKLFDDMKFSYGYKNTCKSTLNKIFEFALKNDLISKNKVKYINLGKNEKIIERKPFTKQEINVLWENKKVKNVDMILILIYTGLRINELLSLENNNIDLINKTLTVVDAKTPAGIRIVPIASNIFNFIKENINFSNKYFLMGGARNPNGHLTYDGFKKKIFFCFERNRTDRAYNSRH